MIRRVRAKLSHDGTGQGVSNLSLGRCALSTRGKRSWPMRTDDGSSRRSLKALDTMGNYSK